MSIYGLIGEKLGHSFSPMIHEKIFDKCLKHGYYHLFEMQYKDLKGAIQGLKVLGAKGVNVTIPYKVRVMNYLDELSDEARKIGAVNTIDFKNGKITGYNTDYHGFGRMMKKAQIPIADKKAVVLGTGGACKAVIQYLKDHQAKEIILVSRDVKQAQEKYKDVRAINYETLPSVKGDCLMNTTPCGMYPNIDVCAVDEEILKNYEAAIDLIYNPKETLFLKYAKKAGKKAVNGLYMLVEQAIVAQEIWNDSIVDESIREKIYEEVSKVVYQ